MGLFKLIFWPMRMLMWPIMAPLSMIHCAFKMVFRFFTVMLLFANLLVTLFVAATLVIFTVVPTLLAGLFGLYWVMKKMCRGRMCKSGKMHMCMPSPRRFKP
jgi:hypothetical protein